MRYDFDEAINRTNTHSVKFDYTREYFGTSDLIPMWVADMDFRTPDFIMQAIRKRTEHEILGYSIRPDSFYQAIINWYRERQDWSIERDWILFSPGVVAALSMAVNAFTREGEKVIVQPPVYHPFFSVIKDNKRELVYNTLLEEEGYYRMDLDDLKQKIGPDTKLLLLSHPHNPVGRVWSPGELKELADLCLENNIVILSDEIHSDLVFHPHVHTPLSTLSHEIADLTVTCIAASKTFNLAGLSSSAVIISNEKLRTRFSHEAQKGHLYMGNIFGTIAMETAYREGADWLEQLLAYLKGNAALLTEYTEANLPGIRVRSPEATYLAWLDMRNLGMKSKQLRNFMTRDAGIGCNDGPSFGPGGNGYQRLNFACPRSTLQKALHQLKRALDRR
ncbi:MAG: cystathionine beta-lyase [Bacteroides sp. SM23_62]|nr:MAG: cystathionine beta-lyase [Bacteroides sp. SM23_62]